MKIPSNYDRNAAEGFEALTPGGHKCVIMQAEEKKSQNGKQMLVVSFDTSEEDTQPKYFSNRYLAARSPRAAWMSFRHIRPLPDLKTSDSVSDPKGSDAVPER